MQNSNFRKNFVYTALYKILLIIAPIVTAPYLSRVLGPEGIGIQSYCQSVVLIFNLFATLGVATYGERQISYHRDSKVITSTVFWNVKILSAILMVIVTIFYLFYCIKSRYKTISLIFAINLINTAVDCTWVFHGFNDFGTVTLLSSLAKIFDIIFIFTFVHESGDLGIHVLGTLLFPLLAEIVSLFFLKKYIIKIPHREINPFRDFKTTISLFLPTIAVNLYSIIDKIMIGNMCISPAENGFYEQAYKVAGMSAAIISSVSIAGFSDISYYWKNKNSEQLEETMRQSYTMIWAFGFPLMFGLMGVADNFVPWFFGADFEKVAVLIKILAVLSIPIGISSVSGAQYLVATGKQNHYTISCVFSLIVNFILNIVLIRKWLSVGAAIASITAEIVLAVIQSLIVLKEQKASTIFKGSWKYASAALFMFVVLTIENRLLTQCASNTILIIFSGVVIYGSCLIFINDSFFISIIDSLFNIKTGSK